jgi:ribosome maturation factor RimP
MIDKQLVQKFVEERIEGTNLFIVSIHISESNHIQILIDGDQGVSIDQCISVSRNVEHQLDREVEDFSLEVSSYGLSQPIILPRQFAKNIGKEVEIKTLAGDKINGILLKATDQNIKVEQTLTKKQIKEGLPTQIEVAHSQIKEVKSVISFK